MPRLRSADHETNDDDNKDNNDDNTDDNTSKRPKRRVAQRVCDHLNVIDAQSIPTTIHSLQTYVLYENTNEDKDLKRALLASLKEVQKPKSEPNVCVKNSKNDETNKRPKRNVTPRVSFDLSNLD